LRLPTRFECVGCGATINDETTPPFRCPAQKRGDDIDHLLVRNLNAEHATFPPPGDATNPFLAYRDLFHARHLARGHGLADGTVDEIIERLDAAVAAVDGRGFRRTPFPRSDSLSNALGFERPGGVSVKDETGGVGGSHKARHLFGILVYLEVTRRLGIGPGVDAPLAIASCGNAALAAAIVARAAKRPLEVFVPVWANGRIVARLRELGARVTDCPRRGDEAGDPSVLRFREAVNSGAIPFTCQGSENGLTIEGGETLGWEMASAFAREGRVPDRLFVQVGGGALATAVIAGLREARDLGAIETLPRVHTVQTEGGWPLKRAYDRVAARMLIRLGGDALNPPPGSPDAVEQLRDSFASDRTQGELEYASRHRSEFMWPWESEPHSLADGILDDETYDWLAVVRGMIETGGGPVVVSEDLIKEANDLAQNASPNGVSHTGSAGLAGLVKLVRDGEVKPSESVVVLLTGLRRV
jgi:threonine synthase